MQQMPAHQFILWALDQITEHWPVSCSKLARGLHKRTQKRGVSRRLVLQVKSGCFDFIFSQIRSRTTEIFPSYDEKVGVTPAAGLLAGWGCALEKPSKDEANPL